VRLTLDPSAVESAITDRTTGILAVHVYGVPCDVYGLADIAERHGLKLLYDGAHSFGTELDGRPIADFGDATVFSFHATKLFNTAEGGAVVARDENVKKQVELLRNFGIVNEVSVLVPGINGKLSELHAALGLSNLARVDAERTIRGKMAEIYRTNLPELAGFTCIILPERSSSSYQYFAIRIDSNISSITRDELYEKLKSYNIFARRYFYPLCSTFPFYRNLPSSQPENLPVAHIAAEQVLCLPFYGGFGEAGAARLCAIIKHESEGRILEAATG